MYTVDWCTVSDGCYPEMNFSVAEIERWFLVLSFSCCSVQEFFGQFASLVCNRLMASWKGELGCALAAMEVLSAFARIKFKKPNTLYCKRIVNWICEFVVFQCKQPAPAHSKVHQSANQSKVFILCDNVYSAHSINLLRGTCSPATATKLTLIVTIAFVWWLLSLARKCILWRSHVSLVINWTVGRFLSFKTGKRRKYQTVLHNYKCKLLLCM